MRSRPKTQVFARHVTSLAIDVPARIAGVNSGNRFPELSWTHHLAVAALPEPEQVERIGADAVFCTYGETFQIEDKYLLMHLTYEVSCIMLAL